MKHFHDLYSLEVRDDSGKIKFTKAQELSLTTGQRAYQLESVNPIKVFQNSPYRFRLFTSMERDGEFTELTRQLPYPQASLLQTGTKEEGNKAYAEIPVYI